MQRQLHVAPVSTMKQEKLLVFSDMSHIKLSFAGLWKKGQTGEPSIEDNTPTEAGFRMCLFGTESG